MTFCSFVEPSCKHYVHAKRHRSRCTIEVGSDSRARKKERTYLECARRASFVDKEALKITARGIATGAFSSIPVTSERSTTDGVDIYVGTTEGDPSTNIAGYGKSDLPTC